jgi:hypothetical protein
MKRRFKGEYEVDPPSTGGPAQMEEVERERERERERIHKPNYNEKYKETSTRVNNQIR